MTTTTTPSALFTKTTGATTVPFHPLLALASLLFATGSRNSVATDSTADQGDSAYTWGL